LPRQARDQGLLRDAKRKRIILRPGEGPLLELQRTDQPLIDAGLEGGFIGFGVIQCLDEGLDRFFSERDAVEGILLVLRFAFVGDLAADFLGQRDQCIGPARQ
jgi:hypothetical protein